jgi:hypothetical protein
MGADGFVAVYGVKFEVGEADAVDAFNPPWRASARRVHLQLWSGRLTDGSPHYVVVGKVVGQFGVQGPDSQVELSDPALAALSESTRRRLAEAGVPGEPALHLLFEAQY